VTSRAIAAAVLTFGLLAAVPVSSAAQQGGSVTGVITNKQTDQPISGAQVFLQNTRYGALTDQAGRFAILNVPTGTYNATAQFIGFAEARQANVVVRAGAATQVSFALEPTVLPLQELVVTGTTDPMSGLKMPVTVAKLTKEQLQVPATNGALAMIQGKIAGASVIRSSGAPGEAATIMFRSPTASELSNEPLIVIDGVVIARSMWTGNPTMDIESMDIESIEVIKGAAAASLYGSRAAAGVISITTARGKDTPKGTTRITTRTELGQSYLGRSMPLNQHHHYRLNAAGTSLVNTAGRDTTWAGRTAKVLRIADETFPGRIYDNVKSVYQPNAFMSNNVTLTQNADNTTFLISLNRWDENGVLVNNDGYYRNTGRFSLDHRIGDKLSFSFVGQHARTWRDEYTGDPFEDALVYPTFVNLAQKDADGNYLQAPDSTVTIENPLWRQATRDHWEKRARTIGSSNARYSPIRWLTFDLQLSYDRSDLEYQEYVPKGVPQSVTADQPTDGSLYKDLQGTTAYNGSFGAAVTRQFGDLNARFTARGTIEREEMENTWVTGIDFLVQGVRDLDAVSAYDPDGSGSQTFDVRANGYLADLGLDYKDRYIVDALIRRDGSSVFGPSNKWHNYYRVAAAYRISQEPWFKLPGVDEMKFKMSEGTAGGRPGFSHQYERWSVSPTTGLLRESAGNSDLRPSHTREREFGMDMILLNNRLSLELAYATQKSSDQIIGLPHGTFTGWNQVRGNGGENEGHTYEATVQARLINRRNLSFSMSAVADRSRNKITQWDRACFWGSNAGRDHEYQCPGASYGDFWIYSFVESPDQLPKGVRARASEFQVNDEGYLVWVGPGNTWQEGISKGLWATPAFTVDAITYRWGEPIVRLDEDNLPLHTYQGTSLPDLNFGFTSNLRYKQFSLYTEWRGQLGGKVYNTARQDLYGSLRHGDFDQTGKPDGLKKSIDYYQRALYNGFSYTDRFLEDGTHLRLGAMTARYRFNNSQLSKVLRGVAPTDLSIGITGRNLLLFTGFTGFDPEAGSTLSRESDLNYPHLRSLTATIEITF
jgi:TonB-linked SusC/RagA family outer membrane protein